MTGSYSGSYDGGTDDSRWPMLKRPRFYCPACGAFAQQDWTALYRLPPNRSGSSVYNYEFLDAELRRETNSHVSLWHGAKCASCDAWSIWYGEKMAYPSARVGGPAHRDMPQDIAELYAEAAAVASVSRRAGAALARAMVERLIVVLDPGTAKDMRLDKRIERIKLRVSSELGEMLDVVRYLGNKMLHIEDGRHSLVMLALDDQDGPALLELLLNSANALVDQLITKPTAAGELWRKLPEQLRSRLRPDTER